MSGHIGDAIATAVPAVGAAGTGYATDINALLAEFKARLIELVPNASIVWSTNSDLDGAGFLNVGTLTLTSVAAVPASPTAAIVYSAGEFYLVTAAGAIQVTNGGFLNIAATGGIGGDYGSTAAIVTYVDASIIYNFMSDPSTFAGLGVQFVDIWNFAQTFRTHLSTGATANYNLYLPTGLPAGQALMSASAAGAMSFSTPIAVSPTFSADIILSGAAKVQHGAVVHTLDVYSATKPFAGGTLTAADGANNGASLALSTIAEIPIHGIPVGARITALSIYKASGTFDVNVSIQLYKSNSAIGTSATGAAASPLTKSGLTEVIAAGDRYSLRVTTGAGGGVTGIKGATVTFDQPV